MALAASMGEPPPMATMTSGWASRMAAAPFMTVSTEGSGSTPSKWVTARPASLRMASRRPSAPHRCMDWPPVTTKACLRVLPRTASSFIAPGPK